MEFFFSKEAALKRYATIKRLHPEAIEKTAVKPFFRPNGEIQAIEFVENVKPIYKGEGGYAQDHEFFDNHGQYLIPIVDAADRTK